MRDSRGRSEKSSGRIAFQSATASRDFEKNRWPPISNGKPLQEAVRLISADIVLVLFDHEHAVASLGETIGGG